jgi:hypothetical protein
MALLTQEQAEAIYNIAEITKYTMDSDPTKGSWIVVAEYEGYSYNYTADQDVLAMNATDQQVKDKFIEIAKTNEYKGILETYTETTVNKV